jgi:hypothetical protein
MAMQGHGGWHHPIHVHLVDYAVLAADGRDSDNWSDWDWLTNVSVNLANHAL